MALLNNDKDVLPLSSISELLNAKIRTLKMYEDKKRYYSLAENDRRSR